MSIKAELLDRKSLSPREGEVLLMICEGKPDKVIARALAVSCHTVTTHIQHINMKLVDRTEAINMRCAVIGQAVARGMVRLSVVSLCALLSVSVLCLDDSVALRPAASLARVRNREV